MSEHGVIGISLEIFIRDPGDNETALMVVKEMMEKLELIDLKEHASDEEIIAGSFLIDDII